MGSRLGWILAAIFGGGVITIIAVVVFFPFPTEPTSRTTDTGMLSLQQPAEPISLVLGSDSGLLQGEGNAGENYRLALEKYKQNPTALTEVFKHYTQLAPGKYRLAADELRLLKEIADDVAAGAAYKQMKYYFELTPKKIELPYRPSEPSEFQDLMTVVEMLAGDYIAGGEASYPEAERRLFHLFALGYHLMAERARLAIVRRGLGLQVHACDLLIGLYRKWKKPDRAREVHRYREGLRDIRYTYGRLDSLLQPVEATEYPGDIFNLVAHHGDRAVRVEAILALGMVKLTATKRGDHRYVRKWIGSKLSSDDALERAAAECAEALDRDGLDRIARSRR